MKEELSNMREFIRHRAFRKSFLENLLVGNPAGTLIVINGYFP